MTPYSPLPSWRRRSAALVLCGIAMAGCSDGNSNERESQRDCAVVNSDKLSDILDADMSLEKAEKGSSLCVYTDGAGDYVVQLGVEGPVEAGFPELLLTEPEEVAELGSEAFVSTDGTPLGTRLIVRDGGAMLTVDLEAPKRTNADRKRLATEIGEAGLDNLEELEVKEAEGERGDEACDRFRTETVATQLGGVPTVTPSNPPGSCTIVVEGNDLTVAVSSLIESGATQEQLDTIVAGVADPEAVKLGESPGYWIASGESGGQLDLLDEDRLLQIAVVGGNLDPEQSKELALSIATAATA